MHQSILEEDIGLGFIRFSRGIESTRTETTFRGSKSISDSDDNNDMDDTKEPISFIKSDIESSKLLDEQDEHLLSGTSYKEYKNSPGASGKRGRDSLNANAFVNQFLQDFRTDSDGQQVNNYRLSEEQNV